MLVEDPGIVKRCFISIAISIPQDDAAYEVLQQDFIDGFNSFYLERLQLRVQEAREQGTRVNRPILLDEEIHYVIQYLPVVFPGCQSLSYLLTPEQRASIIERFLHCTQEELLTEMAKRPTIRNAVRRYLHQQDSKGSHSAIESNKVDTVFNDFTRHFLNEYATSYRFDGSFIDHVMHSFTAYYYKGHSKDIWAIVQAPDFAKQESENNLMGVAMLEQTRTDDVLVGGLLTNISELNDLLFEHAGQSKEAHGICYDSFYLIIDHLVGIVINRINERVNTALRNGTLGQAPAFTLQLVDELDRKVMRNGLPANRGIHSKISNEKMLLPVVFERIREGNWSLDNITELRDQCFMLGKKDRDGKNCVWKDVEFKGETSRYLDKKVTYHNYMAFEKIFKGVLSIYTLMKMLEERGKSIVLTYPEIIRVLSDKALTRSVDYLSALDHLDLIYKLQHAPVDPDGNNGDLLVFDDMVWEYAGSEQNNHDNIRANRYHAFSRGLLDNPRLKQAGDFQTPSSQLKSVAYYMDAIPHCHLQYIIERRATNTLPNNLGPKAQIRSEDIVAGKYSSPYQNQFMARNPEIARYYLYDFAKGTKKLTSFAWRLGFTWFPGVKLLTDGGSLSCIYIPMKDIFLLCPDVPPQSKADMLYAKDIGVLNRSVAGSVVNGRYTMQLAAVYSGLPWQAFTPYLGKGDAIPTEKEVSDALNKSLGFDCFLGFGNLLSPYVKSQLASFNVYPTYKNILALYTSWLGELSLIQNSLVDLLYLMLSYGLYTSRCSDSSIGGYDAGQGAELVMSLLKSEFKEDNLSWFFSALEGTELVSGIRKVNTSWTFAGTGKIEFEPCDLSCLSIVYGKDDKNQFDGDSLTYTVLEGLQEFDSPAKRFVQLYNDLNTRLTYLHVLRDAYSLMFNVISADFSTLGCELSARFDIEAVLRSAGGSANLHRMLDNKYALLDSIRNEDILSFVGSCRRDTWQRFSLLGNDLIKYFSTCRQDITKLLDYEVTSSSEVTSNMQDYGSAFFAIGRYNNPFVDSLLKGIWGVAKCDDAGFLMTRNSYFKGRSGGNYYYVHITGRLLEVSSNNTLRPMSFDFSKENDRALYESIIRGGYASV